MSEQLLIDYGSPTLAGIKIANLFNVHVDCDENLSETMVKWNLSLNRKGIHCIVLKRLRCRALIYMYRKKALEGVLNDCRVKEQLNSLGYNCLSFESAIDCLKQRCLQKDFPHEIGFFLGYPFADVMGFMMDGGKNALASGHWKVYDNVQSTISLFQMFTACTNQYKELYSRGVPLNQLAIS